MNPVTTAIWYIEQQVERKVGLDDVAAVCGVSRFHLARAFSSVTGRSVMRYLRGRRLSEAARKLASGAPDILDVAFDAGYGSHEAFTRAFRERFGVTPESVRAEAGLDRLDLEEIVTMPQPVRPAAAPRFVDSPPLRLLGMRQDFTSETAAAIPALWGRFAPRIDSIGRRANGLEYGVCAATADGEGMSYAAAVAVTSYDDAERDLVRIDVPAARYAVFLHESHVAELRGTFAYVMNEWLPASGYRIAGSVELEVYDERFDPQTGLGGVEVWIPLAP